jgi:hypothetical protein
MLPIAAIIDVGMKVLDKFVPDPEAKAKAQAELIKMQQEGRLAELNADNIEAQEISKRWQADMASDSWLSKNIRPMTLVYLLTAFILMAVLDGYGFKISEAYVTLLGQWGMLVMTAYFGGRSLEKIMDMRAKKNA